MGEGGARAQVLNLINWVHEFQPQMVRSNINEGVIDVFNDENTFYKSFNLTKEMSRTNVIMSTFGDLQDTYEKHKKDLFKGNLKKKLQYFTGALRRLMQEKKDIISSKENNTYQEYIQQVDIWIASLSKK